jgi:hypothetical protein
MFAFALCSRLVGQEPIPNFVLNPSMPYVYVKFDHVGPRKPLHEGEGQVGLWLRIVNNCRVPIKVPTFGLTTGDPGVGLLDEVVSDAVTVSVSSEPEELNLSTDRASTAISHPQGYSAEVFSMTRILPGKDILFSVPLNHVSDQWFMRVRFVLDVDKPSLGTGPYTYLNFFKGQIPPSALSGSQTKPDSLGDTLLHETGDVDPPKQP